MDANIVFVECCSPVKLSRARLIKREMGPCISDARIWHFEQFKKRFEPLNEIHDEMHIRINTEKPLKENIHNLLSQGNMLPVRENAGAGSSLRIL
jgi:hypothetical protein